MKQKYKNIKSALLSIAVSLLASVLCIGCSDSSNIASTHDSNDIQGETESMSEVKSPEQNTLTVNDVIQIKYDTGFNLVVDYGISDEDYNLYNEIMDYLYAYPDKSEDELYEELGAKYNKTASELKQFTIDNMQNAIKRKMGNSSAGSGISNEQIIECAKSVISATVENNTYFSNSTGDWEISNTGLRYLIKTSFGIIPSSYTEEAIVKIEFSDNYNSFELFQLKYNGINIDLK